jgi:hypothetical protein
MRALDTADKQQARFWEPRAAVSRLRIDHDVTARERLKHLCADFSEGFGLLDFQTGDLSARLSAPITLASPIKSMLSVAF